MVSISTYRVRETSKSPSQLHQSVWPMRPQAHRLLHIRIVRSSLNSSGPYHIGFRPHRTPGQVCLWEESHQHHPEYSRGPCGAPAPPPTPTLQVPAGPRHTGHPHGWYDKYSYLQEGQAPTEMPWAYSLLRRLKSWVWSTQGIQETSWRWWTNSPGLFPKADRHSYGCRALRPALLLPRPRAPCQAPPPPTPQP